MKTRRTELLYINLMTCSKMRFRANASMINPSPKFHKSLKRDNIYKL